MEIKQAISDLKKEKERKFDQSVDLIINLKGIDVKRDNIATIAEIPHKFKDKKVCGFLSKKSGLVDTITEPEFQKYKDKDQLKNLVKKYDFFIAEAPLMPKVATNFGKVLGPAGKMPSPQLGIVPPGAGESAIKPLLEKIAKSVKIRVKEPSIKISVGKQNMDEGKIIENANAVYNSVVNSLPNKKENVKEVMIKFTMTKPLKVEIQ